MTSSDDLGGLVVTGDAIIDPGNPPWWRAPLPRRWHRCTAQTAALVAGLGRVWRCPCGAMKVNSRGWTDKNSRRRRSRKVRP